MDVSTDPTQPPAVKGQPAYTFTVAGCEGKASYNIDYQSGVPLQASFDEPSIKGITITPATPRMSGDVLVVVADVRESIPEQN